MHMLATIVIGFIVGLLARAIMPGDQKMGFIMTTLLGIGGSIVASYAGLALGLYAPGTSAGWIASVVGAIVLLFLYGLVAKKG